MDTSQPEEEVIRVPNKPIERQLKGVIRVGNLAKGLLIRGDRLGLFEYFIRLQLTFDSSKVGK